MKNLSLFVSAFALFASSASAQTINCGTMPSCTDLGYTDTVADCPLSSEVLKCPFDLSKGKCQRGPAVGDLKYSLKDSDHDGWLLCDGRQFSSDSTAKYYKLFQLIGTKFCHKFTSKTDTSYTTSNCTGGMFALPDYRGFFLRAATKYVTSTSAAPLLNGSSSYSTAFLHMGGDTNTNIYTPMYERLPNITGGLTSSYQTWNPTSSWPYGSNKFESDLFKCIAPYDPNGGANPSNYSIAGRNDGYGTKSCNYQFDASKSNSIYQNSAHIIPANYSAYVFIYAGR